MTREEVLENELELAHLRIKELEGALGVSFAVPRSLRLTGKEASILGIILQRDIATRDQIMAALYSTRMDVDLPEPKIIDVLVCKIRAKLKPLGIAIETHWGQGWSMSAADKAKVNEMTRAERECTG